MIEMEGKARLEIPVDQLWSRVLRSRAVVPLDTTGVLGYLLRWDLDARALSSL